MEPYSIICNVTDKTIAQRINLEEITIECALMIESGKDVRLAGRDGNEKRAWGE